MVVTNLSGLGPRLDCSPMSEESRTKLDDTKVLEVVDWFDFFRERPNRGIRVIFFFVVVPSSSPDGTSKFAEVVESIVSC